MLESTLRHSSGNVFQVLLAVETLREAYIERDDDIIFGISLLHAILLPIGLCFSCKEFKDNTKRVLNVLFCMTKKERKQHAGIVGCN